jgi:hypothetical protein
VEAVQIRRRLATTSPATFVPDLGALLHNLSIRLSEMGGHGEALAATEEAVQVFRQLAAVNRAAFEHRSAESLNNLVRCS